MTNDLVEFDSPAFFLTKALFDKKYPLKQILRDKNIYKGLRDSKYMNEYSLGYNLATKEEFSLIKLKTGTVHSRGEWQANFLKRGHLLGLETIDQTKDILPRFIDHNISPSGVYDYPTPIQKSFGGGLLGTQTYILYNAGRNTGEKMDGGRVMMRQWSRAIFRELLCRELPVISEAQSKKFVRPKSEHAFWKSDSCVQCHASTDYLSGLLRNKEIVQSGNGNDFPSLHITSFETEGLKLDEIIYDMNKKYYLSRPQGKFVYQSLFKNYIESDLSTLDDLGRLIGNIDDFYFCTAKKYLNFLTGIDINLTQYVEEVDQLSEEDKQLGRMVFELGFKLKADQSLNNLLINIIKSSIYKQRDYKLKWPGETSSP